MIRIKPCTCGSLAKLRKVSAVSYAVAHDDLGDPAIDAPLWVDLYNVISERLRRRES